MKNAAPKIVVAHALIPAPPPAFLKEDSRVYVISSDNPLVPCGSLVDPREIVERYGIEVEINENWIYSEEKRRLYYLAV